MQIRRITRNRGAADGAWARCRWRWVLLRRGCRRPGRRRATRCKDADWWFVLALAIVRRVSPTNVAYARRVARQPCAPDCPLVSQRSSSQVGDVVLEPGGTGRPPITAMQVRFLQKNGLDLSSAVAAGGILSGFGALVAAFGCFGVALVVEPAHVDLSLIPTNAPAPAPRRAGSAAGPRQRVARRPSPCARARVLPPLSRATRTMMDSLRSARACSCCSWAATWWPRSCRRGACSCV